jgi:DNA-binding IclR family transcriptional regulator
VISLSSTALGGFDVRKIARPAMRDLADLSKASVGPGVRERLSVCYVECFRSSAAISLNNDAGSRISVAASAMGRAYIAVCGAEERAAFYDGLKGLDYFAWPQLRDGLDKTMDKYRTLGCCTSFGEWSDTVSAIAAGFRPVGRMPAVAINCGGPTVIPIRVSRVRASAPHRGRSRPRWRDGRLTTGSDPDPHWRNV